MPHEWPHQGLTLRYFSPREFKYPEHMAAGLLEALDELRHRVAEPLTVTSDGRLDRDMERIYGPDRNTWPDSAHWMRGGRPCWAVDLVPERKLMPRTYYNMVRRRLTYYALHFEFGTECDGCGYDLAWPRQGTELATAHVHVDMHPTATRPWLWTDKSR